jgi:integrase
MFLTALGTGMRRGEILALRWQDLDLDAGILRVERSLEQTKAGLRVKAPKTRHGRRAISLPDFLIGELRSHWKGLQEVRLKMGLGKSPDGDTVFSHPDGTPRTPNGLTKEWQRAAVFAGLGVTFHALRHTHASQLIASGLDVLTISRRLGHGSPTITLGVYGHLFANTDDRAAKAMDAAFSATGAD